MKKWLAGLAVLILFILANIQHVTTQCSSLDVGVYDCSFIPSNRYSNYYAEVFQMSISTIVFSAGSQSFRMSDEVCNGDISGEVTIINSSRIQFDVQTIPQGCDDLLFTDVNGFVPLKNVYFSPSCDYFSGMSYFSDTGVNKGTLICSLRVDYNDNSAAAIAFSSFLFFICFTFFF